MFERPIRVRAAFLAAAVALFSTSVRAAPVLVAPHLESGAQPEYPPTEITSGKVVTVVLTLDVGVDGKVTNVTVGQSGGEAFDRVAIDAARGLTFTPATKDGTPIAARIPFTFTFEPPPPPEPPASAPVPPPPPPEPAPEAVETIVDIDVKGDRAPREATKRTIDGRELEHLPGTNGDALHAIENLPGVARTFGFTSDIVVRGSAPEDTAVFVDGTRVTNAFHFGGLSSVIPSEMLARLDFYPGNFSPEFGRQMGGIIDLGIRSPRKDRIGGLVQFDLVDGRILAEGPLNDTTRFLVAGRRSWVDAWLPSVLRSTGVGVTSAPVYYDYQALVEHDFGSRTTGRLLFFGSADRLALSIPSADENDPGIGGDASNAQSFYRLQARLDSRLDDGVRWINMASVGRDITHVHIGDLGFDLGLTSVDVRSDLRARISPFVTVIGGLDFQGAYADVTGTFPPQPASGQVAGPTFGSPKATLHASRGFIRPGAYFMAEFSPIPALKLIPGVRVDESSDIQQWVVDPRFTGRYDVHEGFPKTTLKGGVGLYHQPPEPQYSIAPFGTPSVREQEAIHYDVGIEQEITHDVSLTLDFFYKDLRKLIVTSSAATASGNSYDNAGSGRAYGSETMLRWKPGGRFSGWIAYTLSRSERRLDPSLPYTVFDYDQTHILNVLGSYALGRGWTVGARFRYVTGNPYTPYVGATVDLDAGTYVPTVSPRTNSARLPAYNSLDLRVDKVWTFQSWKLSAYLDVRNVYNRKNPEGVGYNYDYSRSSVVSGLPFLPIVGVRGEL